jgi:hypothetical protein
MEDVETAHVGPVEAEGVGDGLVEAVGRVLRTPDFVEQFIEDLAFGAVTFVQLPLTFLSAALMQQSLVPGWIRTVSKFNPVNRAVEAARGAAMQKIEPARSTRTSARCRRGLGMERMIRVTK